MEGAPQTQTKSSEQIKNGNQVSVMSTGTKEEKNTEIAVQPDLSPRRAMKIEDPERHSRECISNGLVGCHMEDVLRQHSEEFIQKKKQIIVLTSAGKPVYCYGRNEEDLTSITGVIRAIEANFESAKENLKSIETENAFFVLERIGSLLFFCYTPKEGTTVYLIREQLHLLYQQLIILLSQSAMDILDKKQNYDIRELLGNSATMLTTLLSECDIHLFYTLRCYMPVLMPPATRDALCSLFLQCRREDTIYCGLGVGQAIAVCLQHKSFPLDAMNQLLIQAMITTNPTYRSSEGWLPICITDVRRNAFLHLYVGFVTDDVFVFFVTTATDPEVFSAYSQLKERIYTTLVETDRLIDLYSLYNAAVTVTETGVDDLIHFVFKSESSQVILPRMDDRIYDYQDYHQMIVKYQLVYSYMTENNLTEYYESTSDYVIHATKSRDSIYIIS
ncbi:hypothetical protein WA538_002912 [Blastocystis sp. DL]